MLWLKQACLVVKKLPSLPSDSDQHTGPHLIAYVRRLISSVAQCQVLDLRSNFAYQAAAVAPCFLAHTNAVCLQFEERISGCSKRACMGLEDELEAARAKVCVWCEKKRNRPLVSVGAVLNMLVAI